ncbi:transporter [Oceanirhabdus seepicola]|uniref:Transporter n=1 Tax=Oceanirhabdus seepicola TaxID=2828781 RepID=A0A9J6P9W0_9CLOT|nr:transporter [Oceanirhabdus seepicola]MCM1992080.1 transporter [Oceanirhabdus seepicola]
MKKEIFQITTVFIGTIVGAGLASGQEITQFFSTYGLMGFTGLLICCLIYMVTCNLIVDISQKYSLSSYTELITKVGGGYFGKVTELFTSFFLISGAAIILAGSGALINQYFGVSKWLGIFIMAIVALVVLLNDTKGLIFVNSFIVPSLVLTIILIFTMYIIFFRHSISLDSLIRAREYKTYNFQGMWFLSALLYAGFNILSFTGVLVPLSKEIKNKRNFIYGIFLGAIILTIISLMINLLLTSNIPNIFKYEVPLLYIANHFKGPLEVLLLIIIWCEMFSTEISDIYSVGKTMEKKYNIPYKKCVCIILAIAIPISQLGFKRLITILYPLFGFVSVLFIIKIFIFKKNEVN